MNLYILDDAGNHVQLRDDEVLKWGEWFNKANRRIAITEIEDRNLTVSTVFLGMDYNFGAGPPLLYETMVFGGDVDYMERYATRQEALDGHEMVVTRLRNGESFKPAGPIAEDEDLGGNEC